VKFFEMITEESKMEEIQLDDMPAKEPVEEPACGSPSFSIITIRRNRQLSFDFSRK